MGALLAAFVLALLPGGWELKLVLTSLAVIAVVTTWYRIRHVQGARRVVSEPLPVECAVSWRERRSETRDDRFPAGGFGGTTGKLRIEEDQLVWNGTAVPVGEIRTALALTPRDWTQRSADRVVLRIRTDSAVWDFHLAQPWILERELPFPLERRSVPNETRPFAWLTYAAVLAAILAFVVIAGPIDLWRSRVPRPLAAERGYEGPVLAFSYPASGWSVVDGSGAAADGSDDESDLEIEGPDAQRLSMSVYATSEAVQEALDREVEAAIDAGCLRGAAMPAFGRLRGAGTVLVCGEGEAMVRRRVFFAVSGPGRLLRIFETRPFESGDGSALSGAEEGGLGLIERSLRVVERPAEEPPSRELEQPEAPRSRSDPSAGS